jgi:hypothetical protein
METSMAEIVVMNVWRDRKGRKVQTPTVASNLALAGEIVMFTGVRYERFDDHMDRKADNHAIRIEQK